MARLRAGSDNSCSSRPGRRINVFRVMIDDARALGIKAFSFQRLAVN